MARLNPDVVGVVEPPVATAKAWFAGVAADAEPAPIDLSQAVPGYPPAEALRAHLAEVVLRPETAGYAPARGLAHVRAAIAADTARRGDGRVGVEHVAVTTGCNQAYVLAIDALARAGDEVVLTVPFYFNHHMALVARSITPVLVPLDPATGFVPDPDAIARVLTERTRAIVLVSPSNPTGAECPPAVLEACFELAAARGVALVLDETYREFRTTDAPPHRLFARDDWPDTLVHLMSYSKVLSLAGYRVGALVAGEELLREVVKLADDDTICAPRVAQEAVAFGLTQLDDWIDARRADMAARVDACRGAFASRPGGYELLSAGAYFAYVRHPHGDRVATEVARELALGRHLLGIPGEAFGPGQERHLRLAFGNVEPALLADVAARLEAHGSMTADARDRGGRP